MSLARLAPVAWETACGNPCLWSGVSCVCLFTRGGLPQPGTSDQTFFFCLFSITLRETGRRPSGA